MKINLAIVAAAASVLLPAIPLTAADSLSAKTTNKTMAVRSVWPPETLSGQITMIDPARNLVVVQTPDGVPFDLVVTGTTRIESGRQAVSFQDLKQDTNQPVTVKFVPERSGDIARTIRIG